MIEIQIDTNGLVGENIVRASRRRITGGLHVGDRVRVTDISDGRRYYASVETLDGRSVTLKIDWGSEMLSLDSIDSAAHSYFSDVPTPRLVEPTHSRGAGAYLVRRSGRDAESLARGVA